jgi:hypothetical protein
MASDANQHMYLDQRDMQVKLWDLGPKEPKAPERPVPPSGKEGSPDYDLALIEFRGALATYETELVAYGRAKKDFADWHRTYGGPYEMTRYSVDARDSLERDPGRYVVSDKRLKNHGLPIGRKPGPWHHTEQQRLADVQRDLARQAERDPVFGLQGAGAPA